MPLTCQQIADEAMQLNAAERIKLAEMLWISIEIPEAIPAALDAEVMRRVAQLDAGEVET